MAKYSGLDKDGRIVDFQEKSDAQADMRARREHFRALIKVRSFERSSPIATLLPYKKEGY